MTPLPSWTWCLIEDDTNILDRIDTEILMEQIKELLSEKEFDVLCNRYGLEGREQKTHREYAQDLWSLSHSLSD